jgi:hypothetical protein
MLMKLSKLGPFRVTCFQMFSFVVLFLRTIGIDTAIRMRNMLSNPASISLFVGSLSAVS